MSRRVIGGLLALLLGFTATGVAGAVGVTSHLITLSGRLEYVTTLSIPHYEVAGYVLTHKDPGLFAPLVGKEVAVTGNEVKTLTILMKKTLQVETIKSIGAPADDDELVTLPFMPEPLPALPPESGEGVLAPVIPAPNPEPIPDDRQGITLPVIPPEEAPIQAPPAEQPIAIPAKPVPVFGGSQKLLFGRLVVVDGEFQVHGWAPNGQSIARVMGHETLLAPLAGRPVMVEGTPTGTWFQVRSVVDLSADVGQQMLEGSSQVYVAPSQKVAVRLFGNPVNMEQEPVIGNGRTLVGLRAIAEAMGAEVSWDAAARTATVTLGDREVQVTVGSNRVVLHRLGEPDRPILTDITPVIVHGRTMVPARVLSEGLGLSVRWDADTRTVELN